MGQFLREQRGQLLQQRTNHFVRLIFGDVECPVVDVVAGAPRNGANFRHPEAHGPRVPGCIQLDHHANTTGCGIGNDLLNVTCGESFLIAVRTEATQLRVRGRIVRECNRVDNVPVHGVELRVRQRINDSQNRSNWEEMAAGVNQNASVRKARGVLNRPRCAVNDVRGRIIIEDDHLGQRLKGMVTAKNRFARNQNRRRRHIQSIRLVDTELQRDLRRCLEAHGNRANADARMRRGVAEGSLLESRKTVLNVGYDALRRHGTRELHRKRVAADHHIGGPVRILRRHRPNGRKRGDGHRLLHNLRRTAQSMITSNITTGLLGLCHQ
mmetsp:Transcript_68303/g.79518  ORF Transcript_68303/g.79518 Transcript_68303/m.79518 type:complete len:325 (+) Transcript_68303:704-1678(+)